MTLNAINTYTGTTNIVAGTLQPAIAGAISGTATVNGGATLINVGPSGTYDASIVSNLNANQTLIGTGHISGAFNHTTPTSLITPGTAGTAGTLSFDGGVNLAGGRVRADLDPSATAGQYDQLLVDGGSFGANGPGSTVIDLEFIGALPSSSKTYHLVNYAAASSGTFLGPTNSITFNGNSVINPSNLTITSTDSHISGRTTQLAVNDVSHTLDLIYVPGGIAGNLIWTGGTSHTSQLWDANVTTNWNNVATGVNPDKFFNGDHVTFDNTANVPHSISISGTVAPADITINSDGANAFIFGGNGGDGGGKISGGGSLTKSGTSTLTIRTANDYTGGTTINSGSGTVICLDTTSVAGATSALGNGVITIGTGVNVQVGDGTAGKGTITGTQIHNAGSITINRPDASTLGGAIDGAGPVTIQGGGTVTMGTPGSTYTGNTTLTASSVTGGVANSLSSGSLYVLDNNANTNINSSGLAQSVGGLSGGGSVGGNVNTGGGNLTFSGTTTATFAGGLNVGSGTITANGNGLVQNLTGSAISFSGATVVNNGTLNYNPSVDTTLGSTSAAVQVGTAANNVGTLQVGPHAMLFASTITVADSGFNNGNGTIIQTGGLIQCNGNLNITSNSQGIGTLNLSGGTFAVGGPVFMSQNTGANGIGSSTINVGAGEQFGVVNNDITMGVFFNPSATINVNGGTLGFYSDGSLTSYSGSNGIIFRNNNAQNMGAYTVNLNGGVLAAATIGINITADSSGVGNFNLNLRPTVNFNGGTLRATTSTSQFFNPAVGTFAATIAGGGQPIATNVQAGGATIDVYGNSVGMDNVFGHDAALGSTRDGGLTVLDSLNGTGNLTLSAVSTYTGPTKVLSGTLQLGIANAINSASNLQMAGGTLNTEGFNQSFSSLKLTGNATVDMSSPQAASEILNFGNSRNSHWVGSRVLTIANWSNATADQILFPSANSLNANQLNEIQFAGSGSNFAKLVPVGGSFELEPSATATTGTMKYGDVNQDGVVNVADVSALMAALSNLNAYKAGTATYAGTGNLIRPTTAWDNSQLIYVADTNYNDVVDNGDVQALISYIANGGTGGLNGCPEPGSFVIFGLALPAIGLAWRRRWRNVNALSGFTMLGADYRR